MEKNNYCIHLQRKWVDRPKEFPNAEYQRLSYDLINMDRVSMHEIQTILKHFSIRSNGEFKYWITDIDDTNNVIYSTDLDVEQNEEHIENICALHSGESETNTKGSAE